MFVILFDMSKTLENNLVNLFSSNRLSSYKYDINDTDSVALERYLYNIEISKSLYPLLSILEISLRNRINQAIETVIKQDWILKELNQQSILLPNEHKKLLDAKQKLTNKGHKNFTKDDVIAELSLGFWIHLCTKDIKLPYGISKAFLELSLRIILTFLNLINLARYFLFYS